MKTKLIYADTKEELQRKVSKFLIINKNRIDIVDMQKSMFDENYIIIKYELKDLIMC